MHPLSYASNCNNSQYYPIQLCWSRFFFSNAQDRAQDRGQFYVLQNIHDSDKDMGTVLLSSSGSFIKYGRQIDNASLKDVHCNGFVAGVSIDDIFAVF